MSGCSVESGNGGKVQKRLNMQGLAGGGLLLTGGLALAFPDLLAVRANLMFKNPGANIWLIYAFGFALISLGLATLTEARVAARGVQVVACAAVALSTLLYFLALSMHLQDWWIDDAGITFAYSRSLAEGLGLVAQPWLPPEEGYSSSIWMLLLSFMHRLGVDIPMAAKALGIGCSALAMVLCAWIITRETRSPLAVALCGIAIACAPTVVWAVSGQEHALQSLLLLLVVLSAYALKNWRGPVAVLLALLVLTRPEAPIIVIAVFCAAVLLTRRADGPLINVADAAVALLPFAAFVALMLFRSAYFGDFFPNPYYAKSSGTSLIGVFNLLGGGWAYILAGLRDTALIIVLGLVFVLRRHPLPDWFVIALAVLAGHLFFVIWAKGDWMSQYRFLMPILPVALLVIAPGLQGLGAFWNRTGFALVAALVLAQTTAMQMTIFKQRPTTPFAVVTDVGNTFRALADRLEIEDPLLAHHDAGGIAYHRMIRLLDLGGLISRTIGKNMSDRAFLTAYLLEETQPDFVFGARNFAASSGFSETKSFENAYVRLEFTDLPFMESDLSYIRRDLAEIAAGITLVRDEDGTLTQVIAEGLSPVRAE